MNSINQNSIRSSFSIYQRKDTQHQFNFNEFQQQSQNSQSLGFAFFNHINKNPVTQQKNDTHQQRILSDQNIDMKDATIGFNQFDGILENSIKYSTEQFKAANIKKAPTFHFAQGYMNTFQDNFDSNKENSLYGQPKQEEQSTNKKEINESQQTFGKRGAIQESSNIKKQEIVEVKMEVSQWQEEQQRKCFQINKNVKKQKKNNKNNEDEKDTSQKQAQYNMQNLKSIAKLAYQGIKDKKVTNYKYISDLMLNHLYKENTRSERSNQSKSNSSTQSKTSKKNQLIQSMIQAKSFSQIKQMKQMQGQQDDEIEDHQRKCQMESYQINQRINHQSNLSKCNDHQTTSGLKNIRRRLYDAINVMLSANVIQKRPKGQLAIKMNERIKSSQITEQVIVKNQQKENQMSFEQLQKEIVQKHRIIEAKRKYRQVLTTKYLTLKKHIERNKFMNKKNNQTLKLEFPLIFTNVQPQSILQIQNTNTNLRYAVQISSRDRINVYSDMDVLGFMYWVERDEIRQKQEELQNEASYFTDDMTVNENKRKRVKLNEILRDEQLVKYEQQY